MEEDTSMAPRPTRKDLIKIRKKIYNLRTPPKQKRRRSEVIKKKKPGRKPETLQGKALKVNDFDSKYPPSDVESDYEGYLSENEDFSYKIPTLRRSQSSDSIFIDMNYKDFRSERVSHIHQCDIYRPKHSMAKTRRRKMNRILQKHSLRFLQIEQESLYYKEMIECYHGNMPRLASEVARTKNCLRNPHRHTQLNIPDVFSYGDAGLVDICSRALKEVVAEIVAKEHMNVFASTLTARDIRKTFVEQRSQLSNLPKQPRHPLPTYDHLAMEFFFLRQVKSRNDMVSCITSLNEFSQKCTSFATQPEYLLKFHMRMLLMKREEDEFEEFLTDQRKRRRHLDRTLKLVMFENRSAQADNKKQHERRLARRAHAEKVAARKKLTPAERKRLAEEDKKNTPQLQRDKGKLKELKKKEKEVLAALVATRLRQEAKDKVKYDAEEAEQREQHRERVRKMQISAEKEKEELYSEYHGEGAPAAVRSERKRPLVDEEYRRMDGAKEKKLEATVRKRRGDEIRKEKEDKKKDRVEKRKLAELAEEQRLEEHQKRKKKEELFKKSREQKRRKLEEKRLEEIEEERRRQERLIIKAAIQKRLKAKLTKAIEERLMLRRQELRQITKNNRTKRIVADLKIEAERYLAKKKDVTLYMCSKDQKDYFESAREAFTTANCGELLEQAVPDFADAYKSLGTWENLLNYLVFYSDPMNSVLCPLSKNYIEIADNVASGFIYRKGENSERKWTFEKDLELLFHDIDPDLRAKFEKKLVESRRRGSRKTVKDSKFTTLRRTKSEETRKPSSICYIGRTPSCMDLTEIHKYAEKKWSIVRRTIAPELSEHGLAKPFDQNEVLNAKTLFSGISCESSTQKYDVIAGILGCSSNEKPSLSELIRCEHFEKITLFHKNFGLLQVAGEPVNKYGITSPKVPMPLVGELHKEFLQYKKSQLEKAEERVLDLKKLAKEPDCKPFLKLTDCYQAIFRFNMYLFELYLNTVESQIFNCYAVYQAEKKQDVTFIKAGIAKFQETVNSVSLAFFNLYPLVRQFEDLCQLRTTHTKEEIDCHVASLCRFAINRIRVPAIADRRLTTSSWVNFSTKHEDTLTIAELSIQDTIPPRFNEDEYLKKLGERGFYEDGFKKKMNTFHDLGFQIAPTVIQAMFWQNDQLFEEVRLLMPNKTVDSLMKAYYRQQHLESLLNVLYMKSHYLTRENCSQIGTVNTSLLIAAIVERGRSRYKPALKNALDDIFVEMSAYRPLPLPLYPSIIGVSFVSFEQTLMISVVKEARFIVNDECIREQPTLYVNEEMILVKVDETIFYIIVGKGDGDGQLDMCFLNTEENYKNDRCTVRGRLDEEYFKPEIRWDLIIKKYFVNNLNGLNHVLSKMPVATNESNMLRLGRLELRQQTAYPTLSRRKVYIAEHTKPPGTEN